MDQDANGSIHHVEPGGHGIITVGVAILGTVTVPGEWNAMSLTSRLTFDPTSRSLTGLIFSELVIGVLGILVISAEYGTGTIRSTLAAVPNRPLVLATKSAVSPPSLWSWGKRSPSVPS